MDCVVRGVAKSQTRLSDSTELYPLQYSWASLVVQIVKNLPAMRETWVRSLGWEDPLEKGKATHSSILAWRIPWTEEPGGLQSMGSQSRTRLSDFTLPFPSPGDLPNPGIELRSPALQADSLPTKPQGKPLIYTNVCVYAKSCPTLCDPMDCSPPGSSIHGIL